MATNLDPGRAYRCVVALTAVLFVSYLTVAMSLAAVPLFVVHQLHRTNAFGGLAVGIAFLSTILTRGLAGASTDRTGGKRTMQRGLVLYAVASAVCGLAALPALAAPLAATLLLAGRLLLGLGESYGMVGMVGWSIALMGPARSGLVLALVGAGMYGAFVAGGPLGLGLLHASGFGALMAVCALLPLLGLLATTVLPAAAPHPGAREPFRRVVGRIWREGAVVGLQGIGFAALGAFFALDFLQRGWPHAGLGLTCFGLGFVLVRALCGRLPDRLGGTPVAIVSLAVEALGQLLLWAAPSPLAAFAGATLTGIGCSMVFPAMGAEVVKRVPPQVRGTAIGGFAAFQDVAYGATGPVLGLLADRAGYPPVFLAGGIAALLGLALASLRWGSRPASGSRSAAAPASAASAASRRGRA